MLGLRLGDVQPRSLFLLRNHFLTALNYSQSLTFLIWDTSYLIKNSPCIFLLVQMHTLHQLEGGALQFHSW